MQATEIKHAKRSSKLQDAFVMKTVMHSQMKNDFKTFNQKQNFQIWLSKFRTAAATTRPFCNATRLQLKNCAVMSLVPTPPSAAECGQTAWPAASLNLVIPSMNFASSCIMLCTRYPCVQGIGTACTCEFSSLRTCTPLQGPLPHMVHGQMTRKSKVLGLTDLCSCLCLCPCSGLILWSFWLLRICVSQAPPYLLP